MNKSTSINRYLLDVGVIFACCFMFSYFRGGGGGLNGPFQVWYVSAFVNHTQLWVSLAVRATVSIAGFPLFDPVDPAAFVVVVVGPPPAY